MTDGSCHFVRSDTFHPLFSSHRCPRGHPPRATFRRRLPCSRSAARRTSRPTTARRLRYGIWHACLLLIDDACRIPSHNYFWTLYSDLHYCTLTRTLGTPSPKTTPFDATHQGNELWIVMEYLAGGSLLDLILRQARGGQRCGDNRTVATQHICDHFSESSSYIFAILPSKLWGITYCGLVFPST